MNETHALLCFVNVALLAPMGGKKEKKKRLSLKSSASWLLPGLCYLSPKEGSASSRQLLVLSLKPLAQLSLRALTLEVS